MVADTLVGSMQPGASNPGLRIAADPRTGTLWTLYERPSGSGEPKTVTYVLNRSIDGGATRMPPTSRVVARQQLRLTRLGRIPLRRK